MRKKTKYYGKICSKNIPKSRWLMLWKIPANKKYSKIESILHSILFRNNLEIFPVQCGIECRLKTYGPKGTICNRGMSIHGPWGHFGVCLIFLEKVPLGMCRCDFTIFLNSILINILIFVYVSIFCNYLPKELF